MHSTTPTPPLKIIGRYAIFEAVASGGMATVHLGRLLGSVGFSRTVAIKRLRPQYASDPQFVAGFLDEARLASRIRHPNVVPTLDVVETEGEIFIVMDYVHGDSLSRLVNGLGEGGERIPPRIGAAIVRDVLQGLHAAHEVKNEQGEPLGIVHRDVSPQNVIVGIEGVTRVFDFGIAKASGRAQVTREGQIKGKLAYMAPEQLLGGTVTRLTDVFAASIVLWEVLTGKRLFGGAENEGHMIAKILHSKIEPPSKVVPALGDKYDAIVMKGLERDPANRFTSAREMAQAMAKDLDLADAAEIGAWLEKLERPSIMMRAERVATIESTSSVDIKPPSLADIEGVDGLLREAIGVTHTAAARDPTPVPAQRRKWNGGPTIAVAVAATVVAVFALRGSSETPATSTHSPGPIESTSAAPPSTPAPSAIPSQIASAAPSAIPSAIPSAAASIAPNKALKKPTTYSRPAPPPRVTEAIPEHL